MEHISTITPSFHCDDDDDISNQNHHYYVPYFPFWCGKYVIWGSSDSSSSNMNNNDDGTATPVPIQPQQQYDTNNDDENHIHTIHNNNNNNIGDTAFIMTTSSNNHNHQSSHHNNNHKRIRTIHGLAIDVYGRATIGMSSLFLGPALLQLANIAAGCTTTTSEEEDDDSSNICTNTIYGFRPSSLLTNIAAISGMIGCIALPFIGSIMDHTNYRKYIGSISGIILCCIKMIEYISLSKFVQSILPNVWLYIVILQIVASVTFYTHLTAAYAYLSELSSIPQQQSHYNTSLFIIMYGSTLFFMVEVLLLSNIFQTNNNKDDDDDDVGTAQTALFITIITCTACFYYSWTYCFPYATAKKVIPLHQSVYSAGFYTLYHTMKQLLSVPNIHHQPISTTTTLSTIHRTLRQPHHHIVNTFDNDDEQLDGIRSIIPQPNGDNEIDHNGHDLQHFTRLRRTNHAMFYILCSVSFSEAAANAIIVISTTYMKEVLQFNANQIGVVFFIVLISGIPGSQLGRYVTISLCSNNPVRSLMYCNLLFGTSTILAAMILRGPKDIVLCYMFGGCWGMCLGWLQPQNTSSYVPIIPRNQEAEMMGLYLLACQIFSWLPPTIFTVMNELHLSMYYGIGSLSVYFLISLICLFMVGDYLSVVNTSVTNVDNHKNTNGTATHHSNHDMSDTEMTLQQRRRVVTHDMNNNGNDEDVYYPSSPLSSRLPDIAHRELT